MRKHFVNSLIQQATKDSSIFVLVGDLGYGCFDEFLSVFPDRFLNVGVAEQNMTGIAAGLAHEGYKVVTYSIGNFNTLRCLEQIRNDVCYHNLNVKIVSVGAGFAYGSAGYTHFAIEDVSAMRVLPNLHLYSPGNVNETILVSNLLFLQDGPAYLRLGSNVSDINTIAEEGKISSHIFGDGDVLILTMGNIFDNAYEAAQQLSNEGIKIKIGSVHTLVPFNDDYFAEYCKNIKKIITIEEHGIGGLFSIISEAVAKKGLDIKILPIFVGADAYQYAESQTSLRVKYTLDVLGIKNIIVNFLNKI